MENLKMSINIGIKQYMSLTYLKSVINLLNKLDLIEESYKKKEENEEETFYVTYSLSSIILSIAFFESTINEFFNDISEIKRWPDNNGQQKEISTVFVEEVNFLLQHNLFRRANFKMYEKYNAALKLAGKDIISETDVISKNLRDLVDLRNLLIHANPEWVWFDNANNELDNYSNKLEEKYKNKFDHNPMVTDGPFFPNRCIGFGCAKWSMNTVLEYSNEFFKRMELISKYEYMRSEFNT